MWRWAIFLVSVWLLAAACGPDDGGDDASATPFTGATGTSEAATPSPAATVGIIAIGHSGLTGRNTVPPPGGVEIDNSWATGSAPGLNSIYQRLVAVLPETEGHLANFSENGATASQLADQARVALNKVPAPALVIIETIDNDIRCNGSDEGLIDDFGEDLRAALDAITEASPASRILIVSQRGRPERYAAAIQGEPAAVAAATGSGMCDFFDRAGNLQPQHVATLTSIIEMYEAEQVRVCAEVPQCSDDGGVFSTYVDELPSLSSDWGHMSAEGHRRAAETIWPAVAQVLALQ